MIVRPRGGDFLYSDDEFEVMREDVLAARTAGADGVVVGILHPDGTIDATRTAVLIEAARPMAVTFHRAFDLARDPFEALEVLVTLGIERVLTSGQEATALEGLPLISALNQRAGARIIVMPGGGITRGMLSGSLSKVVFKRFTLPPYRLQQVRCISVVKTSTWEEVLAPEYSLARTSANLIREVMQGARARATQ